MKYSAEFSTITGIILTISLIIGAVFMGNSNPMGFMDVKSLMIVLGGTFFLTLACFSFYDIQKAMKLIFNSFFLAVGGAKPYAINALKLSEYAYKEGMLKLDKHKDLYKDSPFLTAGVGYILDNLKKEEIQELVLLASQERLDVYSKTEDILRKAAEISPAMGLIGTLIGLVQMLASLDDPSTIGPAMAVALLTTLYGAFLAYVVFTPLASKISRNSEKEEKLIEIFALTINSILKKENPRQLENLINSTLPKYERIKYFN